MRVAIYARYSTDLQSEASIEDQLRLCREWATQQNANVVEMYSDYAIGGGSMRNRPGILALLEDARFGRFDVVIAEALDRVSRDQEDIAAIFKRLTHEDVRLTTLAEGDISELHVGLKGTMNALFLKDLAQKTRRGQRGRVEAGKIPGGKSYGYRVIRRLLADGSAATGEREIDPCEATIVRRIFTEYASGLSPRLIASRLNKEDIASPRGGSWNASTINGSRRRRNGILNNELYLGRITWNRQRFLKDPESGKRVSRLNPLDKWVTVEVPELRIIDDSLWEEVQALKSRYTSRAGNKRQTKKRLLSGLIKCGRCGGSMTIARHDRYYCSARREKGTCDADRGIHAKEVEDRVLSGLRDILIGNEELLEVFTEEFKREISRRRGQQRGDRGHIAKELTEVDRGIARCLEFITSGDGKPGLVRDQLSELEARKQELEAELKQDQEERIVEVHPNFPELYRKKVEELRSLLEEETSRPQAMELIRSLIERIDVFPGEKRGECDVELTGTLAGILAFTQNQKTAASYRDDGTSLVVAGGGFEPLTFRL